MSSKSSNNAMHGKLQLSGAILSLLCGIHCAALPLILLFAPALSSQLINHFWMDVLVVASILIIGYVTIGKNYLRGHIGITAIVVFFLGLVFLIGSHLVELRWLEASTALLGGTMLAGAQFYGLRSANQAAGQST